MEAERSAIEAMLPVGAIGGSGGHVEYGGMKEPAGTAHAAPDAPGRRYDLDRREVTELLADQPQYRVSQLWHGLYARLAEPAELTELPQVLRARLSTEPALAPSLGLSSETLTDQGRTLKWLWSLSGGAMVETVLMHYPDRSTVCVSTQAGCAMGCGFCATGQAGFTRHLSTGEIVEQVVAAARSCRHGQPPRRLTNVVFMGMGEPLANFPRVWGAIERLHTDLGLSARHLTVSTVGVVPGIRSLATKALPVGLAVSLHAANDALRDRLVPLNRRWPLASLMDACHTWREATGRRLSFEWALIDQVNDSASDAAQLADWARPLHAHVNLIPLNATPGWPTVATPPDGIRAFARALADHGVNATVRRNRGTDIDAACGQLAARTATAPALVAD